MENNSHQCMEVCARALIINDDKILVVKRLGADHYFLPGGHVEFGEEAEKTIVREMKEETGSDIKSFYQIGANENIYIQDGIQHHEYNLVFKVELDNYSIKSLEDHLTFDWIPVKELDNTKILPGVLKRAVVKWLSDQQPFWAIKSYY